MRAEVRPFTLRLRRPLRTAHGELDERPLLVLRVEDRSGRVAFGEAAPLEPYDGVSLERCAAALEAHAAVLSGRALDGGAAMLDACRAADDLPQALAAVDLALWSLAGLREGRPVSALLTDRPLDAVPVNAVIGADDPEAAAAEAARAVRAGFTCLKVKAGVGDDAARLRAVRAAAGPDVLLRIDANGAWTAQEAPARLAELAEAGLELAEEPVHGVAALRAVRAASDVPLALDETGALPGAIGAGATDAVCLKISRAGGVSALLAQAALVRASGAEPYLASTLDGPLGIAAALHCAAALRVTRACGLATLDLFDGLDPGPLAVRDGAIRVPREPGLGVKPAE
jgi:L-alanine-DL-glutamate epimerase-like enolase superfamily enzyme